METLRTVGGTSLNYRQEENLIDLTRIQYFSLLEQH